MNFFGIGLPEMVVIAAIGLLVFGPKRLPELGKTLGRTLRGFQSASQEFEKEFRNAITPEASVSEAEPVPAVPPAAQPQAALVGSSAAPETIPAVVDVEPVSPAPAATAQVTVDSSASAAGGGVGVG